MAHRWSLPSRPLATIILIFFLGCRGGHTDSPYFGVVTVPSDDILHYVSGAEPESLDPQLGTSQNAARIQLALFEGLVEYDPETLVPIPGIAEGWTSNNESTEFTFHLRSNARWSDGSPITADDFVYTIRRGLDPKLASANANLASVIRYADAYNSGAFFVRDAGSGEYLSDSNEPKFIGFEDRQSRRLVLPANPEDQERLISAKPGLRLSITNKVQEAVRAEDVGVVADDKVTLRFILDHPAPYFVELLAHPFFRAVPRKSIETHGPEWSSNPDYMVCSGAFTLESWQPYDKIVVKANPHYWDHSNVRLKQIVFYPVDDQITIMNMYKVGQIDAMFNHQVPASWYPDVRNCKDYMDAPEAATEFYSLNVRQPPTDNLLVRRALNLSIDKEKLGRYRRPSRPLTSFTPDIFPGYKRPEGEGFDPAKARDLLAQAGYKNRSGEYEPKRFPADQLEISFNSSVQTRAIADFVREEWRKNLGIEVNTRGMESRTFSALRQSGEYSGIARDGWSADFMDPFAFLGIFRTEDGSNTSGWTDPGFSSLLNEANRTTDAAKRFELLREAEIYLLKAQPVIPLLVSPTSWMKKPYVKGMFANPQTMHPWKFVYIERASGNW